MNIEDCIKGEIAKKLEDGTVEKMVSEQFENSISLAVNGLLSNYGDVTKMLQKKIKEVMIPYVESYDYSDYIVKLDAIMVEVLKSATLDNKKLLENFKNLLGEDEFSGRKKVNLSEIWREWQKHVVENVETDGLEVCCEDGKPEYEMVEVSLTVEEERGRSWSIFKRSEVYFECEHDEKLNVQLNLSKWEEEKENAWSIDYKNADNINSIRNLNDFEIFLMKLNQSGVEIEIDTNYESEEITPEAEPEADWS